jgi:hypothetical protein
MLARILGYPTRVSVGFLPGTPSRADPDAYVVRGNDAHAWPEVYFEGYGWVPFEPTPRAEASTPSYTVPSPGSLRDPAGVRNGTDGASSEWDGRRGELADVSQVRGGLDTTTASPDRGLLRNPAWIKAFNRFARAAFALLAAVALLVPLLKGWRARRALRRARDPRARARAAFHYVEQEAAELASERGRSETAAAYGERLAAANRVYRDAAREMACLYEAAEYGRRDLSQGEGDRAVALAKQLRASLWETASWWQRALRLLSPRPLLPRLPARRAPRPVPV